MGDPGSIPGWGRVPGEGNGNPLQYSCLENSMDRGAWLGYSPMRSQWVRHDWVTNTSWLTEGQNGNIGPSRKHWTQQDKAGFRGQLDLRVSAHQESLSFIPVSPWVELDFSLSALNTAETWLPAALDWLPHFKEVILKEVLWLANIDGQPMSGPMTVFRGLGFNDYPTLRVWGWRKKKGWSM